MQYIYVLQSKADGNFYIGNTQDLRERLRLHNAKKIAATKRRTPFILLYYEAYIDKKDAFVREQYMKTQWGHNYIRKTLSNFFNR